MPIASSATVHPSAVIAPTAIVGEGVTVGPYVVLDEHVTIGPGCTIRPHAHITGITTLGANNDVGSGCVLGERPQHLLYKGEPTALEIGDGNVFREHVTIHRGSPATQVTRIGNNNYFMAHSHIAHDCRVGHNVLLANGVLIAGHCELHDRCFVSGNSAIHQFTRIGRLALLSGMSASTKDILPFVIVEGRDRAVGVNVIGMRRAGIPAEQIMAVREAYRILYRSNTMLKVAMMRLERELGHLPVIMEMVNYHRESRRGVIGGSDTERHLADGAA